MSLNLDTETVFCYSACLFDEWWHLFAADTKYFFLRRAMIYAQSFHTCIFPKILVMVRTQGSWKIHQLPKSLILTCRCIMIVMGWMTFWKIGELTFLSAIHIVSDTNMWELSISNKWELMTRVWFSKLRHSAKMNLFRDIEKLFLSDKPEG